MVATCHVWPMSIGNVARINKEQNLKFYLIITAWNLNSYKCPVAPILESTSLEMRLQILDTSSKALYSV